jgi:putative ABC transport system permease protein
MWSHYLKMAYRALAADRFFTFVNLTGLSIGLAAVVFIFLHVSDELGRDSWIPDHANLYRVDTNETHPGREPLEIARAPGPLRDALLKDFPEITGVARAYLTTANVLRAGQPFRDEVLVADPNLPSLLGLPIRSGSANTALASPASVMLSERAAKKFFGATDAVGRRLTIRMPASRDFTVSAVFKTLPESSHMRFDVVIPFDAYFGANTEEIRSIPENWGGAYFFTYARVRADARIADLEAKLPAFVDRNLPDWMTGLIKSAPHEFYRFRLVPVTDIQFDGGELAAMKPPGSRTTLAVLSGVALLILGIATINFANLTTARSTLRAKEVALRKVVGATRRHIFVQFLAEAALMTCVAGLLGLCMVELALPYVGALLGLSTPGPLAYEWRLWSVLILVLLVTAVVSGFYPAVVVSRIRPAAIFRGNYAHRTGASLKGVVVVVQFAITITLITVTTAMLLQMRYTKSADLGFDKEGVLVVRVPAGEFQGDLARSFEAAVSRAPGVIGATTSSAVPSDQSEDNLSIDQPGSPKPIQVGVHRVDSDFFRTYGVTALAGRTATTQSDRSGAAAADSPEPVVVNVSALRRLALGDASSAVGRVIRSGSRSFSIVGVIPDVHFRSLREQVRDEVFLLDEAPGGAISIRFRTNDVRSLIAAVDRIWAERAPGEEIEREFLDDSIAQLYAQEDRQVRLLALFSGVAIVLSCLGLLGIVAFAVQRRTKEMAVRKVLGAATHQLLRLLLWQFSKPVLLANLIAWPVGWLALRTWLNGFAYRIDVPIMAFVAASTAAAAIGLATVATHSLRVARTSPAIALRRD